MSGVKKKIHGEIKVGYHLDFLISSPLLVFSVAPVAETTSLRTARRFLPSTPVTTLPCGIPPVSRALNAARDWRTWSTSGQIGGCCAVDTIAKASGHAAPAVMR